MLEKESFKGWTVTQWTPKYTFWWDPSLPSLQSVSRSPYEQLSHWYEFDSWSWWPLWHTKEIQRMCLLVDRNLHFPLCLPIIFVPLLGFFLLVSPIVREDLVYGISKWSLAFAWSSCTGGFSPRYFLVFLGSDILLVVNYEVGHAIFFLGFHFFFSFSTPDTRGWCSLLLCGGYVLCFNESFPIHIYKIIP